LKTSGKIDLLFWGLGLSFKTNRAEFFGHWQKSADVCHEEIEPFYIALLKRSSTTNEIFTTF